MQPTNKLAETDSKANPGGEIPIDPFAVDFFGVKSQPAEELIPAAEKAADRRTKNETRKKSDWHRYLPRVSSLAAEFSSLIENLPENLNEKATEVIGAAIARYTFRQPEDVGCALVSVSEANLHEKLEQIAKSPQIFLTIGVEPENHPALLTLNTEFAASIIDLILGGQGAELSDARDLSPIEHAIVEFLAVNILGEINRHLGEPLLRLQSVASQAQHSFEMNERGGEMVFVIEMENLRGMLTVFAPRSFFAALDGRQNPLLVKKGERKKLDDWEKILRRLDLHLLVGATVLDADSLLFLEPDDIVLVEQPQISLDKGLLGDNLQVSIGCGRNFRLTGTTENTELGGELTFKIKEITSEETRRKFMPVKLGMDEKENELAEQTEIETEAQEIEESDLETTDERLSASLENVQVALRVEIAGNKISLRELQSLRAGQIIALGCRPTDPVRLVTDQTEEPIATGELIEIEGQLGVRLTKVFI